MQTLQTLAGMCSAVDSKFWALCLIRVYLRALCSMQTERTLDFTFFPTICICLFYCLFESIFTFIFGASVFLPKEKCNFSFMKFVGKNCEIGMRSAVLRHILENIFISGLSQFIKKKNLKNTRCCHLLFCCRDFLSAQYFGKQSFCPFFFIVSSTCE